MTEPIPFLTIETRCPGCGNVLVIRRTWLGRSLECGHCGVVYTATGPAWQIPQSQGGEPVSPRLGQLLSELSAISKEPDKFDLRQEVAAVESLLRFLASPEGRTDANVWAVRMWNVYSGDGTDYAPDALNDVYEGLGLVGVDAEAVGAGTTPEQLLERLQQFKSREGIAEPGSCT